MAHQQQNFTSWNVLASRLSPTGVPGGHLSRFWSRSLTAYSPSRLRASLLGMRRHPGEDVDEYCRRRSRAASHKCKEIGLWSQHWCQQVMKWEAHLQRRHSSLSWTVLMRGFHDEVWLEAHRHYHSQGTGTRLARGRPCTRWHERILHARRSVQ